MRETVMFALRGVGGPGRGYLRITSKFRSPRSFVAHKLRHAYVTAITSGPGAQHRLRSLGEKKYESRRARHPQELGASSLRLGARRKEGY